VDGALPLDELLFENIPLRDMIKSLNVEKKWLFTNAGKKVKLPFPLVLALAVDGMNSYDSHSQLVITIDSSMRFE
jgi:hypothetical protein